ncbi:MAG: M56 and DUF3738 domain-containing protein [Bryobacteraceae bacterium]
MIPTQLSSVFNHLWQSTLFAAAAGLLVIALRKNQAQARHRLWLIASIKFLVPFSFFVAIGSHIGHSSAMPATHTGLSIVMEEVSQPFATALPAPAVVAADATKTITAVLFAIWLIGFVIVALCWCMRWCRIHALVRAASPLALEAEVPVLSSPSLLEPGVFGIFRPVLLLPEGITKRLARTQMQAILAHEMCHVRRRDNLSAAIHMAVEAIFWFHPLVWWIGERLVEERERACDEEVLQLGNEPQIYAESILKVCQFYLESPLTCVSGVTGSDLKKRIVRIMTQRIINQLDAGRRLLLAVAGAIAVAGPIAFGLLNAPQSRAQSQTNTTPAPSFEVASVKPNHGAERFMGIRRTPGGRFTATNITPKFLIEFAYNVKDPQISGGPSWITSERYDVEAKMDETSADEMQKMSQDLQDERLRLMMQSLLTDRFKLTLRRETKELPIYTLVVAKNGPKLHESEITQGDSADASPPSKGQLPRGPMARMGRGELTMNDASMAMLADSLSRQAGRNVLDETGLKGKYDITLHWTPDESQAQGFGGPGGPGDGGPPPGAAPPPDASGPTLFTALQEQLGLKLEPHKGPVEILVIDHIERSSEN